MTVSLDVFGNFLRLSNLKNPIESIWIYFIQHLNQLNHFKMIESIWNNIQIDWLQSPKNKNKNNNFQTLRTVRVSLTVKKGIIISNFNLIFDLEWLKMITKSDFRTCRGTLDAKVRIQIFQIKECEMWEVMWMFFCVSLLLLSLSSRL